MEAGFALKARRGKDRTLWSRCRCLESSSNQGTDRGAVSGSWGEETAGIEAPGGFPRRILHDIGQRGIELEPGAARAGVELRAERLFQGPEERVPDRFVVGFLD